MVHLRTLIDGYNATHEGEPLTQRSLADAVGTSEAQVSRHIGGVTEMGIETARRYAEFFGVRVAQVDDRFADDTNWQRCQPTS